MTSKNVNTNQEKRTIIVNGYAQGDITREQLALWAGDLTYVSCYSYGFTMEGALVPLDDDLLIRMAIDSGVAPLMVVTPYDENGEYSYSLVRTVFTNPVVRDRLINNIVLSVMEKNYYGVVFNFGHIAAEDRDEFVITIAKAAARLNRRGTLVIVSLVPGINDAGIDYVRLSRAANFLELRTFYWEQAYEPPSAVASIARIREMLSNVTAAVDSRNILLGLSNYAFDWILPFVGGGTAEMITHQEAEERAERVGAPVEYEPSVQAPRFFYTDSIGLSHEVWFENVRSISAKLDLVDEFRLSGVSIWTIMSPFPALQVGINQSFTVFKV